jgi:hypothetical protein
VRPRKDDERQVLRPQLDPMSERKAEGEAKQKEAEARQREAENSFENVAREWWKCWKISKSPRHADTTMRRMEADVFPAYGHIDFPNDTHIRTHRKAWLSSHQFAPTQTTIFVSQHL